MILFDTSLVIDVLRDKGGRFRAELSRRFPPDEWAIPQPVRMEVLRGESEKRRRQKLERHLDQWPHVNLRPADWAGAAHIYADLRGVGFTAGTMDCCIAQVALSRGALLLHRDRDFDLIARVRPKLRLEKIPAPGK